MNAALADETDPLLGAVAAGRDRHAVTSHDAAAEQDGVVDFDPEGHDPDDPVNWSHAYKWFIVGLLALMAFCITFTCISAVPVASRIVRDLDGSSSGGGEGARDDAATAASAALLVTIWELGEAAGPLLIAPLSEMHGRWPVVNAANCLFVAATALAALSQRTEAFIAARALTGLSVAANVLNPAIVGDMFPREGRGAAMSACMLAPLLGGSVGPAISGAVAQTLGWRSVVWFSVGFAAFCELLFLLFFRETYGPVILRRRVARHRRAERKHGSEDGAARGRHERLAQPDIHPKGNNVHELQQLSQAILRPAVVLAGSGVLVSVSLFNAVVFAYYYVMSVSLPSLLESKYGLTPAGTGSALLAFTGGTFVGVFVVNQMLDRLYVRLRDAHGGVGQPEYRLPIAAVGGVLMPLAILAYGWAAELTLPLPILLLTTTLLGFSLLLCSLPMTAYVVDAFGDYSASALTGVMVGRCLAATFLPMAVAPLCARFGWGWGIGVLAALSLALAPIPLLILRYGLHWRMRSKYTRDA